MGCGSRFWVGWAGVLGQSLVEFGWLVEFGSAFFHLWFVGWLCFFFFFPSFVVVFGFGICWYCCCCLSALMFLLLLMIMGGDNILF